MEQQTTLEVRELGNEAELAAAFRGALKPHSPLN